MDEGMIVLVALSIGALVGGLIGWFARNELGRRRLLELESQWKKLHRKTERQRDDLQSKLRDSDHEVAKAERDLRTQAQKAEDAQRLVHEKKIRIKELEAAVKEEQATRHSQKAVITLMKSQARQTEAASPTPPAEVATKTETQSTSNGKDDLKQIRGIGPSYEKKLHELGITSFLQIARWDTPKVEEVASQLGISARRIDRDDWVVGAKYRLMSKTGYEA